MNFLRRIPLVPTIISALVLLTGAVAVSPVHDAVTGADVAEAILDRPLGYVAIAPVSEVLDTLTLLSTGQHIALLCGVLLLFAAWRAWRAMSGSSVRQHALAASWLAGAILVTYAAGALLPRPMASLVADNANIIRIDFHSHTTESHDGHQSIEALREWHRRAGFDLAYITDHASVAAAERALLNNPEPAGGGVTLLQSIEVSWNGEHVSVPGAQRAYKGLLTANLAEIDTQGLRLTGFLGGREPIVIWNHPRNLAALKMVTDSQNTGIRAIEIVNGSPKDMGVVHRQRTQIVQMALKGDIAMTAGSDNHGFGYVTPGWTLMILRGWRGVGADALALEIDKALREGKAAATKVVERRVADPGASVGELAFSVVTVPYRMLTTLSNEERVSWLVWTWLIAGVVALRRRKAA